MDIISQQVCLGSHQQCVPGSIWSQSSCSQTGDCLIDVEQRNVRVLGTLAQSVGHRSLATSVGVVDENLLMRKTTRELGTAKCSRESVVLFHTEPDKFG